MRIAAAAMQIYGVVGDALKFLTTGDDTGGAYAVMESTLTPGGGPPPHIHRREEESFYVLEGEVTFWVGDTRTVAGPGTFLRAPVGVPHRFKNETDRLCRMVITLVPAGLDRMFREMGVPLQPGQEAPPPSQEEIERLVARAPEFGLEFLL